MGILPVRDLQGIKAQVPSPLPRHPYYAPANIFALIADLSDPMGPNLLPKLPFKMLHLWIKQVKLTQTDHPDSRC